MGLSFQKSGKYRVDGKAMTLEIGTGGDARRRPIDGSTMTDPDGDRWIRK